MPKPSRPSRSKANPPPPSITDAEWLVMKSLWARSPQTAAEIIAELSGPTGWKPQTIKTLIGRLAEKGAVAHEPRGREYLYSPAVPEADAVQAESGNFLTRIFGGAVAPMLAHFVEEHPLSNKEIARLRAILDRAAAAQQPPRDLTPGSPALRRRAKPGSRFLTGCWQPRLKGPSSRHW